jgi:hypothetical protein
MPTECSTVCGLFKRVEGRRVAGWSPSACTASGSLWPRLGLFLPPRMATLRRKAGLGPRLRHPTGVAAPPINAAQTRGPQDEPNTFRQS